LLAPLKIIAREMINAATAVAARIVKNQNKRFPRSTKGLRLGWFLVEPAWVDRACADGPPVRRLGESQGKIVWTWRLFTTPDRPYNASATIATNTNSRKPIMTFQMLKADSAPVALTPCKERGWFNDKGLRGRSTAKQRYFTSPAGTIYERQHGWTLTSWWEGRQIGSNRGQGVSTGTTRGGVLLAYPTDLAAGVK
jgi:hypothetical protein